VLGIASVWPKALGGGLLLAALLIPGVGTAFVGPQDVSGAFTTTAHRGENSAVPPTDLITSGVGRADVRGFDATNFGPTLGGTPLAVVTLFGATPRALAASLAFSSVVLPITP
jgi:hypothetical protein